MIDQVLVTQKGVVHSPRTTPSGVVFWPIAPKCGLTCPDAKLFWERLLDWDLIVECQDCNAS